MVKNLSVDIFFSDTKNLSCREVSDRAEGQSGNLYGQNHCLYFRRKVYKMFHYVIALF